MRGLVEERKHMPVIVVELNRLPEPCLVCGCKPVWRRSNRQDHPDWVSRHNKKYFKCPKGCMKGGNAKGIQQAVKMWNRRVEREKERMGVYV